jgi:hypothetical protein
MSDNTSESENMAALQAELDDHDKRCKSGPNEIGLDAGDFYYPVAWLDRNRERVSASFYCSPMGSCWISLSGDEWVSPTAWTIDAHVEGDPDAKRIVRMCGAVIRGMKQFSFYSSGHKFTEYTPGIDSDHLCVITKYGMPCAPACRIGVFGPACLASDVVICVGNPGRERVSISVIVWGAPTPLAMGCPNPVSLRR